MEPADVSAGVNMRMQISYMCQMRTANAICKCEMRYVNAKCEMRNANANEEVAHAGMSALLSRKNRRRRCGGSRAGPGRVGMAGRHLSATSNKTLGLYFVKTNTHNSYCKAADDIEPRYKNQDTKDECASR